MQISQVVSL